MAGALSGLVSGLLGVDNPSTDPYAQQSTELQQQRRQNQAQFAQNYTQEQGVANSLGNTIAGTGGPSVAQVQLRQGVDQANSDAMAAGAGSTGLNSVLAHYQARQMAGEQQARMNQAAALLRAQEVAQAQQQLAALRLGMGQQIGGMYSTNLGGALNYDQLVAALQQQNAQRDTVLGAAGLSGASQGLGSLFSSFGGKGGSGGGSSGG